MCLLKTLLRREAARESPSKHVKDILALWATIVRGLHVTSQNTPPQGGCEYFMNPFTANANVSWYVCGFHQPLHVSKSLRTQSTLHICQLLQLVFLHSILNLLVGEHFYE